MKRAMVATLVFLVLTMHVASAGAHLFLASTTGKLTAKLLTNPTFKNATGTVACERASFVSGEVKTLKALLLTSTIEFEKCTAFGLAAKVSLVNVLSSAEGSVSLLKTVTATASGCIVTYPSSKNQSLWTVKFKNTNKQIEKVASISHITSSGAGAVCSYAEESSGVFTGNALVGLIGGTIDWQ
jgi:hypothetical protein